MEHEIINIFNNVKFDMPINMTSLFDDFPKVERIYCAPIIGAIGMYHLTVTVRELVHRKDESI